MTSQPRSASPSSSLSRSFFFHLSVDLPVKATDFVIKKFGRELLELAAKAVTAKAVVEAAKRFTAETGQAPHAAEGEVLVFFKTESGETVAEATVKVETVDGKQVYRVVEASGHLYGAEYVDAFADLVLRRHG